MRIDANFAYHIKLDKMSCMHEFGSKANQSKWIFNPVQMKSSPLLLIFPRRFFSIHILMHILIQFHSHGQPFGHRYAVMMFSSTKHTTWGLDRPIRNIKISHRVHCVRVCSLFILCFASCHSYNINSTLTFAYGIVQRAAYIRYRTS